jgi:PPOX class probable F420-dependent enzyme
MLGAMTTGLSDAAIELLDSDAVATLATLNADGSPHLSMAWVGFEEGEIVIGSITDQRKLRNIRRDPRVSLTVQTDRTNDASLLEYLVVTGTARITKGGGADLLQRLARTYLGPDVVFPPMSNPPAGMVTRIRIERVGGIGPWRREDGG